MPRNDDESFGCSSSQKGELIRSPPPSPPRITSTRGPPKLIVNRGYALQQAKPVMLRSSIHKPQVLCSEDPILAYGFINLIGIFEKLTSNLYDWLSAGGADGLLERPPTSSIQSSLCKPVSLDGVMEIQQVDILITQQWLQAMMWKLSMSHATQPGNHDDRVLPFHLPVMVGKAVMGVIGSASQGAVDAHGIGMVRFHLYLSCFVFFLILQHH